MAAPKLLRVADVAERLGISKDLARDIVMRLKPVIIGVGRRKLVRLPERTLERWILNGGDACGVSNQSSTSTGEEPQTTAADAGGAGDTTETAGDGKRPPSSATSESLKKLRSKSRAKRHLGSIVPGTKPQRSRVA